MLVALLPALRRTRTWGYRGISASRGFGTLHGRRSLHGGRSLGAGEGLMLEAREGSNTDEIIGDKIQGLG